MIAAPVERSERIEALDILRGFALFGVLLVNVQYFVRPPYPVTLADGGAGPADLAALWLVDVAAHGKFYPIFSLLFGYGLAMQVTRASRRPGGSLSTILWRLGILMMIGLFHQTFLWVGDILATYALLGFVLLLFRNASDRTLYVLGGSALFAWPLLLALLLGAIDLALLPAGMADSVQALFARHVEPGRRVARETLRVLAMFFFGFAAGRHNWLADAAHHLGTAVTLRRAGLVVGGLASALVVWWAGRLDATALTWSWVAMTAVRSVAGPILAVGYIATVVLWVSRRHPPAALSALAPVGRAALTNYLLQSAALLAVVAALARLGIPPIRPPTGVALAVALYGAQVAASGWWLARFRFGPVEWAWRSLSYGRRQPFRA